jgi:hypothetical protein
MRGGVTFERNAPVSRPHGPVAGRVGAGMTSGAVAGAAGRIVSAPFHFPERATLMQAFIVFLGWLLLFVLCWPLAVLAIVLWPIVWLLTLPFRLIGITVDAVFALLRALLFLPARVLGYRPASA